MHTGMTAVTAQSNKIISNGGKDNYALLEPSYRKNNTFGQPSISNHHIIDFKYLILFVHYTSVKLGAKSPTHSSKTLQQMPLLQRHQLNLPQLPGSPVAWDSLSRGNKLYTPAGSKLMPTLCRRGLCVLTSSVVINC